MSAELDVAEVQSVEYIPTIICHGEDNRYCIKRGASSSLRVAIIGDSYAAMLNHFFDDLGKQKVLKPLL